VGSHILDSLRRHGIDTVLLLRSNSPTRFLEPHLKDVEVRHGSVSDLTSLMKATAGVTHVIHCAGRTKAVRPFEFYEVNEAGTRNVVQAVNAQDPAIQRLLHISSLAVSGPATPEKPVTEQAPPNPISTYGKSKLAGELEVTKHCRVPFTILRPPAVYGPRDTGFLSMFKAVKCHLLPRPKRNQFLSLIYAKDLAEAVVACLARKETAGEIYFVASPEQVTGRAIAEEIAAQMHRRTIPCPIPPPVLWTVCLVQETISRLTGKPSLLNLQKFTELRACGWVCDGSKLQRDIGFECKTRLSQGIPETLNWYTSQGWL
jgi:nucleoside-diphosphate-sugar epimerase